MGCDGYILDRNEPVEVCFTCYDCGEEIELTSFGWIAGYRHKHCVGNTDGALKVLTKITNYRER